MADNNQIAVNSFSKGLNSDLSKFKYGNQNYYDAKNIRIITAEGLSSGSVTNTRGTKLDFTFPTILAHTYKEPDGTEISIPELGLCKIIGGTSYDNRVILLTNANDGGGVTYSQVWMFEYDEDSDTIIGVDPATKLLVADYSDTYQNSGIVHLMYNRNFSLNETDDLDSLDFKQSNRIDAFVRVESDKFVRLYWSDGGLNQMRSLNLAPNPWVNLPYNLEKIQNTPLSTIDFITTAKLSKPTLTKILNGNLPNGRVCYFYRLISRDGAITTFSPTTDLIDLNAGNIYGDVGEYPESPDDYRGTGTELTPDQERLDNTSEKAVELRFDNLDENYDYIQPGYIIYTEEELVELFLFPEVPYFKDTTTRTSYYDLIHDGLEETIYPITIQEFTMISGSFEKPKTIQPKNNWMFVANTKAAQFNLKDIYAAFDARSYSHDSNGRAVIKNIAGVNETTITNSTFPAVDKFLDSININTSVYKYQADGSTLGGSGNYVKYSFVNKELGSDNDFGTSSLTSDTELGTPFINATYSDRSFADLRSPFNSSLYASHARGETYRYGLVGVDYAGRESFVEWIADIKIPDFTTYPLSTYSATNVYTNVVGIKFDITLPIDIRNKLREVKIVRVNRTEEHMTRLGTGITGSFCLYKPHKLTWSNVCNFVGQSIAKFVIGTIISAIPGGIFFNTILEFVPIIGDVWDIIKDTLEDVLIKVIVQFLGKLNELMHTRMLVNADDLALKLLIRSALAYVGNMIPIIGSVILDLVGEQVTEFLYERIKDHIQIGVNGYLGNTYSLNNLNQHKNTLDGFTTSQMQDGYSSIGGKDYGYVISPIHQFDKYQFRYGDTLKIVATYDNRGSDSEADSKKIVQAYHRNTKTGLFNRTQSTAALRKWYNGDFTDDARIGTSLVIDKQKTLDVGEITIPPLGSGFPEGTFLNAFIGMKERYDDDDDEFIDKFFSRKPKVMGIGDKKHLVKTTGIFPASPINNMKVIVDQQGYSNSVFEGFDKDITIANMPANTFGLAAIGNAPDIKVLEPRVVDGPGDFMVSYERTLSNQYGGQGFINRALNTYVEVETIDIKDFDSNHRVVKDVYKGDTYVGLYGCNNYNYYFDKFPGYEQAIESKKALGEIFPAEAPFNFNLREGKHFTVSQNIHDLSSTERSIKRKIKRAKRKSKRLGLDMSEAIKLIVPQRFLFDEFVYNNVYNQQKTFKKFYPKPAIDIFTTHTTNRIWRSEPKIDGQLIDSWRLFKPADNIDVEGIHGPINRLAVLRDKLYFYQTNAIGTVITNENSAITDNKGMVMQYATSTPFSNYAYHTTETGAFHRNAVVPTNGGIFHVDVNRKKIFKMGDGLEPLSDIEGISGFLRTNLVGNVVNKDNPLEEYGSGIHGEYYPEYNTVFFTCINYNRRAESNYFTIGYNLALGAFESFHSFVPGLYIRTPRRILTANLSANNDSCYQIFKGNYGEVFGSYIDSYITILTNGEKPYTIKNFDNMTLFTEVYNSAGVNQPNETINKILCTNDYQTTGIVTLTPTASASDNTNFDKIVRQERKWFLTMSRDTNASVNTTAESRMRDFYQLSKLSFTNNANKKFILHDILTHYTVSNV